MQRFREIVTVSPWTVDHNAWNTLQPCAESYNEASPHHGHLIDLLYGGEVDHASVIGGLGNQGDLVCAEAKYIDEKGASLEIPAKLSPEIIKQIQDVALRAFKALCCEGMARVDFFLRNEKEIFVSEINTIPGFTKISMYPKLWEASGIPYTELIDKLIQLALERFEREKKIKISYDL